jgi:predicted tellurium resistance membrane protein TerC
VRRATPLLLVLVCVELSDIVFAVDSIPAVFGVTKDPFIVYTSNIFAIVNLRSLFTVLANAVDDLPYLRPAVAIVLGFVGAKLGAEYFGYDISTGLSLGVITGLLSGGVGLSLYEKRAAEQEAQ